jgi:glycosyltransferase involved in cell wall biosynthesis
MIEESGTTGALVSIVVCAYNNWPDLEMTIESALQQTYQPLEVIVVDNSSTDATANEVLKRFGGRIQYIRQPNKGDAGAYNTGYGIARGEYIQFVDGDDVLAPNKVQKQVGVFQTNPELDIVYGDIRQFQTGAGAAAWEDIATRPEEDILKVFITPRNGWTGIGSLGVLFRRRALEIVGSWDEQLYISDLDYWLRAARAGCRFGHCSGSPMGFLRRHPRQMSANRSAMDRGQELAWEKALGYITEEPYRSLLAARLAEHWYHAAIARDDARVPKALAKLKRARAASPQRISALAYVLGWAAIILPGGSFLVRSRSLQAVRRFVVSLIGYRKADK